MKVELITMMYNEEFLLPFFLNHYSWVDEIVVLYDKDTNDNSESILCDANNVSIIPFDMPDGMDDGLKSKLISNAYQSSTADWVIVADADEFIFINNSRLSSITSDDQAASVVLYDVYRHITEPDLDPLQSIYSQRSHGCLDSRYIKPSIVRGGLSGISWGPGHHHLFGTANYKQIPFIGSHWANADLSFCINRRIHNRRDRQSPTNKSMGWSTQNWNVTEQSIIDECNLHGNDAKLW
jgi:hypothetical protein